MIKQQNQIESNRTKQKLTALQVEKLERRNLNSKNIEIWFGIQTVDQVTNCNLQFSEQN